MTLQDLGNLGEFAGAVAVIASLIYLASQVRSNTKAVRASTFLGCTNGWLDYIHLTTQTEIADLLARASNDPASLNQADLGRVWAVTRGLFRRYENDYYQYRNGLFDADTWASYRISFREDTLSAPLLRAVWSLQRDKFNPEFAAEVDQLAEQARAATKQSEWLAFDGPRLVQAVQEESR
jgi:hypothetical protein